MARPVQDVHWAAYFLNLTTRSYNMNRLDTEKVYRVIHQYCKKDPNQVILHFCQSRAVSGVFYKAMCWRFEYEPKDFWMCQISLKLYIFSRI